MLAKVSGVVAGKLGPCVCVSKEAREHEIIDLALPNLVCWALLARSRMSSYMGRLNLLSRLPQPMGASRPL